MQKFLTFLLVFLITTPALSDVQVNGQLIKATPEKLATPPVTNVVEGRFYYDTVTDKIKYRNASAWLTITDTTTAVLNPGTTTGDTFYCSTTATPCVVARLAGAAGVLHGAVAGAPSYSLIVNADVSDSAAIAYSKLNLATSVTSTDVTDGTLVNADVNASAAIAASKLNLTSATLPTPLIDDYAEFNEESAPSAPSAGKMRFYPKTDHKFYTKNSDGTESALGAGAGEKNYITGTSTAAGWTCVGDLSVATTTTANDLPREYSTASGIKILATAGTQSVADYCYQDFNLDDVDQAKKLKLVWSQKKVATYADGQLAVGFTTQADRTTFVHTPVTTAISASDYVFGTSFDTSTTATLSLVIRATTDMTTSDGVVLSDVVVGPGYLPPPTAIVEDWSTYTCSWTATSVNPTGTTTCFKRRVGDSLEILAYTTVTTTGTGNYRWSIPSGLTIDTNKYLNSATVDALGSGIFYDASSSANAAVFDVFYVSSTTVGGYAHGSGNLASTTTGNSSGDEMTLRFTVPIAEYSGSGTINATQGADVEYACNSNTGTSDNTTDFSYGAAGCVFQGSTLPAAVDRTVRFRTPTAAGDVITMEFQPCTGCSAWIEATGQAAHSYNQVQAFAYQNGLTYGIGIRGPGATPATDVIVRLGQYAYASSTYAAAGTNWSSTSDNGSWRLKKASGASAVGFGQVTQSAAGLVRSAGQLLGTNTNDSAATGYVGEYLSQSRLRSAATALTTNTTLNVTATALTLTAGDWDLYGVVGFTLGATTSASVFQAGISTTSATLSGTDTMGVPDSTGQVRAQYALVAAVINNDIVFLPVSSRVSIAATTTFYLVAQSTFTLSTNAAYGNISARRVR